MRQPGIDDVRIGLLYLKGSASSFWLAWQRWVLSPRFFRVRGASEDSG